MKNCGEWLEKKGQNLIMICLVIQSSIFFLFALLLIFVSDHLSIVSVRTKIYICIILSLFLSFMIYFAFHSVCNYI